MSESFVCSSCVMCVHCVGNVLTKTPLTSIVVGIDASLVEDADTLNTFCKEYFFETAAL